MIIAVDFDGTLQTVTGKPNTALFLFLKNRQSHGDIVILWTCREGRRLHDAVRFCRENGLLPNYVNQNAPCSIHQIGHDSRKVFADMYIDDKSMKPVFGQAQ